MEDEPILKIDDKEYKIADLSDKGEKLVGVSDLRRSLGAQKLWSRFWKQPDPLILTI